MSDRLSEIEGRLAAATPGPWEAVADEGRHTKEHSVWADSKSDYVAEWVATQPDAVMLAHAPADLADLVKFAREVEALHQPRNFGRDSVVCQTCHTYATDLGEEAEPWPCPTAAALERMGGAS